MKAYWTSFVRAQVRLWQWDRATTTKSCSTRQTLNSAHRIAWLPFRTPHSSLSERARPARFASSWPTSSITPASTHVMVAIPPPRLPRPSAWRPGVGEGQGTLEPIRPGLLHERQHQAARASYGDLLDTAVSLPGEVQNVSRPSAQLSRHRPRRSPQGAVALWRGAWHDNIGFIADNDLIPGGPTRRRNVVQICRTMPRPTRPTSRSVRRRSSRATRPCCPSARQAVPLLNPRAVP